MERQIQKSLLLINKKGLSIVEALVALGLISIIALSTISYFAQVTKYGSRKQESCRLYNLSFLNRIRSYGSAGSIYNFVPMPGSGSTITSSPFTLPPEVSVTSRWPSVPILGTGASPQINNNLLINGNMNLLQGLYNSVPGICYNYVDFGSGDPLPSSLRVPIPEQLKVVGNGMKIQIVPYDIDTGREIPNCGSEPSPLYVASRGRLFSDGAGSAFDGDAENKKLTRPANVKTNLGFIVRAKTQYLDEYDSTSTCVTEQKFQYDGDIDAPATPTILSSTMTSVNPAVCSAANTNTFELEVGYTSDLGRIEPGTVLLCQDQSVIPEVAQDIPPGIQTRVNVQCYNGNDTSGGAPPGPQVAANLGPGSYFMPVGYTGFHYTSGTIGKGLRRWVPCNELQLCGVPPEQVINNSIDGPPTRKLAYRIQYRNLPSDCRIIVKTAGVDTSANSSGELASPSTGSNSPALFTGPTNSWDVPRPKCLNFCGYFDDGYFTCGSC